MTSQVETMAAKIQGYKQDLNNSGAKAAGGCKPSREWPTTSRCGAWRDWASRRVGAASRWAVAAAPSRDGCATGWRHTGHVLAVDMNTEFRGRGGRAEARGAHRTSHRRPPRRPSIRALADGAPAPGRAGGAGGAAGASLKPGGWLLLEEMETFSLFQNDTGPFLQVVEITARHGARGRHGGGWARTLPRTFQRLGLQERQRRGRDALLLRRDAHRRFPPADRNSTGHTRRRCGCSRASSSTVLREPE